MEQIDKNFLLITTSIRKPKENATIPDLLVMRAGIVHPIPYHFTPFYIYKKQTKPILLFTDFNITGLLSVNIHGK
jgi:hypothetical protein